MNNENKLAIYQAADGATESPTQATNNEGLVLLMLKVDKSSLSQHM